MDSMFRGSRAPWGRSEDRCDGAGSEADGAIPPVKPGHKLPVLGVLVFQDATALVKPPSSGLRINKARRPPGRFCPAFLIELLTYPIWPAIHTGRPLRRSIWPKRCACDFLGAAGLAADFATGFATVLVAVFDVAGEHSLSSSIFSRKRAANDPSSLLSTLTLAPRSPATTPPRAI